MPDGNSLDIPTTMIGVRGRRGFNLIQVLWEKNKEEAGNNKTFREEKIEDYSHGSSTERLVLKGRRSKKSKILWFVS